MVDGVMIRSQIRSQQKCGGHDAGVIMQRKNSTSQISSTLM